MASRTEYRKLRKIWYKKLKDASFGDLKTKENPEGKFEDIESNDSQLKGGSSNWKFNSAWTTAYSQQSKADYYYAATHFLNTHLFKAAIDEAIWAYHAEGMSIREIGQILKSVNIGKRCKRSKLIRPYNKEEIQQIVEYYREIMKRQL